VERRYLREASRIQKTAAWLAGELRAEVPSLPAYKLSADPEQVADAARQSLYSFLPREPSNYPTPTQAFDAWRGALERSGVLVFLFPLGEDAAQGFSLWNGKAPLIAVNTFWNDAARIFTLFHELGHLLTRTSSVCVERAASKFVKPSDATERWCEHFAAALLIPWGEVEKFLLQRFEWQPGTLVEDLSVSRAIANRFKVSWRAATLRLIEHNAAKWDLYRMIPTASETKVGGGGGSGRNRREIKEDQYGKRATDMFIQAYQKRLIGRTDVLDYLDLTDNGLSQLQGAPRLE
jgi:Zn-dependent peptidase ImmA (M78 family)